MKSFKNFWINTPVRVAFSQERPCGAPFTSTSQPSRPLTPFRVIHDALPRTPVTAPTCPDAVRDHYSSDRGPLRMKKPSLFAGRIQRGRRKKACCLAIVDCGEHRKVIDGNRTNVRGGGPGFRIFQATRSLDVSPGTTSPTAIAGRPGAFRVAAIGPVITAQPKDWRMLEPRGPGSVVSVLSVPRRHPPSDHLGQRGLRNLPRLSRSSGVFPDR